MRNFVISLICLCVLLGIWGCFSVYSSRISEEMQLQSEVLIEEAIKQSDWNAAEEDFRKLSAMWDEYKIPASFFIDLKDINEIDCTLSKAHLYIEAEDISNSSGEISYLKDKFKLLHRNDSLLLTNIF